MFIFYLTSQIHHVVLYAARAAFTAIVFIRLFVLELYIRDLEREEILEVVPVLLFDLLDLCLYQLITDAQ
jgi:hypothetical protein